MVSGGRLGLSGLLVAAACRRPVEPRGPLELSLDALAEGERRVVERDHVPVELRRHGNELFATVLLCTHQGCRVSWRPEQHHYACACHGGVFDPEGRPRLGPPKRPLRRLPVRRRENRAVVEIEKP